MARLNLYSLFFLLCFFCPSGELHCSPTHFDVAKLTLLMLQHKIITTEQKQLLNDSHQCYSLYLMNRSITLQESNYTTDAQHIARELQTITTPQIIKKLLELLQKPTEEFLLLHSEQKKNANKK